MEDMEFEMQRSAIEAQDRVRSINRLLDVCPFANAREWVVDVAQLLRDHLPEVLEAVESRRQQERRKPTERNHY